MLGELLLARARAPLRAEAQHGRRAVTVEAPEASVLAEQSCERFVELIDHGTRGVQPRHEVAERGRRELRRVRVAGVRPHPSDVAGEVVRQFGVRVADAFGSDLRAGVLDLVAEARQGVGDVVVPGAGMSGHGCLARSPGILRERTRHAFKPREGGAGVAAFVAVDVVADLAPPECRCPAAEHADVRVGRAELVVQAAQAHDAAVEAAHQRVGVRGRVEVQAEGVFADEDLLAHGEHVLRDPRPCREHAVGLGRGAPSAQPGLDLVEPVKGGRGAQQAVGIGRRSASDGGSQGCLDAGGDADDKLARHLEQEILGDRRRQVGRQIRPEPVEGAQLVGHRRNGCRIDRNRSDDGACAGLRQVGEAGARHPVEKRQPPACFGSQGEGRPAAAALRAGA